MNNKQAVRQKKPTAEMQEIVEKQRDLSNKIARRRQARIAKITQPRRRGRV
jgi:hypothetical protein